MRDLLLVVGNVLLEQYLVLLLENLDDDSTQELVEGVDAVFRIDGKGGVVFFFLYKWLIEEATPT